MVNLIQAYEARLETGDLRADAAQGRALTVLQSFADELHDYKPPGGSALKRFFIGEAPAPRGLYIFGDVGRGKSMLMDLFFAAAPITKKRRVHFHQFMLEIQDRLHRLQSEDKNDILPQVARDISVDTWLLCFDEFHVGNIADAMILGRLFESLFKAGVIIVATSNWPPDQLYKNGLQRERFLPFIELIREKMDVLHLDGGVDHRFEQTQRLSCYFHPVNGNNTQKLQGIFFQLTDNAELEAMSLPVQGRNLRITHAAKGVGFFNFNELCVATLGSADYLEIAHCLHTVIIDEVPRMQEERRNETMRFINLIDALYEAKVKLYMAAADVPEKLAPAGELNFPFQRTISRLMEMQSETYRKIAHLENGA